MPRSRKKIILFLVLVLLIAGGLVVFRFQKKLFPVSLPAAMTYDANSKNSSSASLPAEINLKIPFTSQAPKQNWGLPYQQFCEEASTLMAASYIENQAIANPEDADAKLLAVKDFEVRRFGFYEDTDADQSAVILKEYFGIAKTEVVSNPTIENIKSALAVGKAVLVPAAGRQLGNPYFQQPGPLYHMLVIKGYRKNGDLITNDPGTRRGADYIYKPDVIMNAIHDWNGGNVDTGRKVMIVVG